MGKDLDRHFTKEDIEMANSYMKNKEKNLNIVFREIKIKTTKNSLVRMHTKKSKDKFWWGSGKYGIFVHCWWECRFYSHYGKQYISSSKNKKQKFHMIYQYYFWVYISKANKITFLKRYLNSHIHCSIIHSNQDSFPMCLSTDKWIKKM